MVRLSTAFLIPISRFETRTPTTMKSASSRFSVTFSLGNLLCLCLVLLAATVRAQPTPRTPVRVRQPLIKAEVLVRTIFNDVTARFSIRPARSLASHSSCVGLRPQALWLTDIVEQMRYGRFGNAAAAMARLQRAMRCLDERSLRALDLAVSSAIYRSEELTGAERDLLLRGLFNPALLIFDALQHTGQTWVVSAAKARKTRLQITARNYPRDLGVWVFDRTSGGMMRIPGKLCLGTATNCKGLLEGFLDALTDPQRLGDGSCSMEELVAGGFSCRGRDFNCSDLSLGGRRGGAGLYQALVGKGAFQPDTGTLGGRVGPDSLYPSPLGAYDPFSLFGEPIGSVQDSLCVGGRAQGNRGSGGLAFEDTFQCLLEERRAYEDSLTCQMSVEGDQSYLDVGTSRAPLDPRCRFGGDPGGQGSTQPTNQPTNQPKEKKVSDLTPEQKKELDKAVKDANKPINDILNDPAKLTGLTKQLNNVINYMNQHPNEFPAAGTIPSVTEQNVRNALTGGRDASVSGILPASSKSEGEQANGNLKINEGLLDGKHAHDSTETMKEEKWHEVFDRLKIPSGPNDDWHHTIMEGLKVVDLKSTGPHDRPDFGGGPENDPCSSEADKLARQAADCQVAAVERLIALGLGRRKPDLSGGPVDPRKVYPNPDYVPPGAGPSCLNLSGGAPPPRNRGCELVLCADENNCRCGGTGQASPFADGGTASTSRDCTSASGGRVAFPCSVQAEPRAARPSLCFATRCSPDDELDPVSCTCRPAGGSTGRPGRPPSPTGPRDPSVPPQ